jgi:hypothetical protein
MKIKKYTDNFASPFLEPRPEGILGVFNLKNVRCRRSDGGRRK